MSLQVSIEQAALNAFAAWLRSQFPTYAPAAAEGSRGVKVEPRWPDATPRLPERAITVIFAGDPEERWIQAEAEAEAKIHDAITAEIVVDTAVDLATAIAALNAALDSYEAHRVDTGAHQAADNTNAVTAPAATDQPSAIALADDMLATLAAHLADATAHENADTVTTLATAAASTTTAGNLVTRANLIVSELNRHYVARIWWWRVAEVEQPVQLDVWATYETWRDDLVAQLVPLLFASTADSIGIDDGDPVRAGTAVRLGDGWPGYADFEFDTPRRIENPGAVQADEFRASYQGKFRVWRLIKKQSSRIARIELQSTVTVNAQHTTKATTSWGASGPVDSYT